jgi:hypothetical protein
MHTIRFSPIPPLDGWTTLATQARAFSPPDLHSVRRSAGQIALSVPAFSPPDLHSVRRFDAQKLEPARNDACRELAQGES